MKCLVVETSNARPYSAAHPVTNDDGTPHVYATMAEARAELKANGYSYSRVANRYYIKGTDARAYIVREGSEEYTEYTEPESPVDITAHHYEDADEYGTIRSLCLDELKPYSAAYVYEDSDKGIRYIVSRAADNDRGNPFSGLWVCEVEDLEGGFIWNCAGNTPQAAFSKVCKFLSDSPAEPDPEHDTGSAPEPRPTYQRAELDTFLGDYADEYDTDAIEAEATEADPRTGRIYWTPEAVTDLWSICERHELYSYAPVA